MPPRVTTPPPPLTAQERAQAELGAYVRRNLWMSVVVLLALLAVVGGAGVLYRDTLLVATTSVYDSLGFWGLSAVLFASDALTSPIPPDLVLVVIANSDGAQHWVQLTLLLGLVSMGAGSAGWWLGGHVGRTRWGRLMLKRVMRKRVKLVVERYGRMGVVLGALTPLPFSITCWLAGMVSMPYRVFWPAAALRIPRIMLYYIAIAYADDLLRLLL